MIDIFQPTLLTPSLESMLMRAVAVEQAATGISRRLAFHNTRSLLGVLLDHGFDRHQVARLLAVRPANVRTRAEKNGLIPVGSVPALTGLSVDELDVLALHEPWAPILGPTYLAEDIVKLLYDRDLQARYRAREIS